MTNIFYTTKDELGHHTLKFDIAEITLEDGKMKLTLTESGGIGFSRQLTFKIEGQLVG